MNGCRVTREHCFCLPVARSHRWMFMSLVPVASVLPSGENRMEKTTPKWPRTDLISLPVAASQRRMVPSFPPVAIVFPSAENVTVRTASEVGGDGFEFSSGCNIP